jgi:glycosyltransferase involved in cell wall biosynthesis
MRVERSRWSTAAPHKRIAWEQFAAPIALQRQHVDLVHAMAFVSPLLDARPSVVTVYDLSFIAFPAAFKRFKRFYLRWMTQLSVLRARRVIAISDSTRRDIVRWLNVPAERVQTIYCGVDPVFRPLPRAEIEAFRQKKGLPETFVFFLGTIEPRKNIVRLIDAFDHLMTSAPADMADVHLILGGGKGWLSDPIIAHAHRDRVHLVGYVPEEEKCLWYNAATCFCYPSLYEGFGLPPLEAMACGVPVITSDAASLPEVVGEAGRIVPVADTAALSEALRQVLASATLRAEMAEKGLARARRFSWARAARQTADTYHLAWEEPDGVSAA